MSASKIILFRDAAQLGEYVGTNCPQVAMQSATDQLIEQWQDRKNNDENH